MRTLAIDIETYSGVDIKKAASTRMRKRKTSKFCFSPMLSTMTPCG